MAISRPKGQSRREAVAAKVGGKLDYKTGKISVKAPVKKVSRTDYSMNPEDAPQTTAQYESRIASGLGNPAQVQAAKNEAKLSSSPSKQKEVSNRMKASKPVLNKELSTPFRGAVTNQASQGTISSPKPTSGASRLSSIFESIGKMWGNNGLAQASPNAFLTPAQRQANLNASIGVESTQAAGPSALEVALAKGSLPDSPTGYGPNGEKYYNDFNPATDGAMMFQSDFATPGTNFSRPGSEQAYNQGVSPITYGAQRGSQAVAYGSQPTPQSSQTTRTPRQTVNQPTQPTQPQIDLSQILPILKVLQDNTPVDNGQSGTRRQFLGNGMLGNGLASNGKLDSGIEGLSYGAPMDQEENLINQLLGIQTAQAQESPSQFSFEANQTPDSAFQNSFANGGLSLDPGYSMPQQFGTPSISDTQARTTRKEQKTTPKPTNTTAQFAQGATGGNSTANPMLDYQKQSLKGFSAQEKAQKKALNELIKSIKNQYSTKQTEGINQLNTSKQEDLLKLSGLFSFANQDPNSEQRIQYEQRANQDYAGQQTDFLAKLAAAMQGDISQANQGYQGKLADIMSQRNTAQYNIAQLLQKAKEDALDRENKGGGSTNLGSQTFLANDASGNPVFWNSKTGKNTMEGLKRPSNSLTPQLQQDENGNWYYEQ